MSSPETTHELAPSQRILQMLTGKWITQAVSVAATLGIADLLKDAPKDVEELAKATGWRHHSIRGIIAGALKKKLGLAITSQKVESGGRRYRIAE